MERNWKNKYRRKYLYIHHLIEDLEMSMRNGCKDIRHPPPQHSAINVHSEEWTILLKVNLCPIYMNLFTTQRD